MPPFEVVVLGVGDTFSERHCTSALLLSYDGFHLAVDCPDRYRAVLRVAGDRAGRALPLAAIEHVLLTHVHGDHMNGLEGVAFYKRFAAGTRLNLLATPEVRAVLWEQRLRAAMETLWDGAAMHTMSFDDYFAYAPLAWEGETRVGPFRIRTRRTRHHVPTCALRVECGGRTFGYSSDTSFDPGLIDFLAPADLIVHETNLGPAHTAYAQLAALPEGTRRKLRLIHYPDDFETESSAIPLLAEGDVLRV